MIIMAYPLCRIGMGIGTWLLHR